jgi:hypothetical protein
MVKAALNYGKTTNKVVETKDGWSLAQMGRGTLGYHDRFPIFLSTPMLAALSVWQTFFNELTSVLLAHQR